MKKLLIICTVFIFFNTNTFAIGERLNIESSRIKKLNIIIKRVNTMYDYINLYILQTATIPADIAVLTGKYSGIVVGGYRSTNSITFTVLNNIVTFGNIVPLDTSANSLSSIVRQVYVGNPKLHENAVVNADLSISIQLKPESIKFLATTRILANRFTTIIIQENTPLCNITAATSGRVWYQPDVTGSFFIQYCNSSLTPPAWVNMSNNLDIALFRPTLSELNTIKPPVGTKGYIEVGSDLREYIFTGILGTQGWKPVKY